MTSELHGKFVWYELTSPDAPTARRFFADVFGWNARDGQIPGLDYSLISAAGVDIAGLMGQQEGMPAAWLGYICVDDIDAAFASAVKAGATPILPVNPIPGVGRFAILIDPTGAAVGFLEYAEDFPKPVLPDHGVQGNIWWRELHTKDREKAFDFYSGQFGWQELSRMPMGPEELYQVVGDEIARGGILTDHEAPNSHWLFYVWVDDLDATQAKVVQAGGKVVIGPMQVPDSTWIIHALDPQGVLFAAVGKRSEK